MGRERPHPKQTLCSSSFFPEIGVEFLEPVVKRVLWLTQLERRSRILVDGIMREVSGHFPLSNLMSQEHKGGSLTHLSIPFNAPLLDNQ